MFSCVLVYSLLYSATLTPAVSLCGEGNNEFVAVSLQQRVNLAMSIPFKSAPSPNFCQDDDFAVS